MPTRMFVGCLNSPRSFKKALNPQFLCIAKALNSDFTMFFSKGLPESDTLVYPNPAPTKTLVSLFDGPLPGLLPGEKWRLSVGRSRGRARQKHREAMEEEQQRLPSAEKCSEEEAKELRALLRTYLVTNLKG